ncbi:MAG: efflux RND transporter periplasmic adaptor subunit [Bacteroidia bacterium]|nr:efflux RND transporter periplasmic adaptor subunit [Bacteroidia bacterium]MDW8236320.1 efflux RND transporter periplasmic adaptor subunit [Bacteroidia bacterium]
MRYLFTTILLLGIWGCQSRSSPAAMSVEEKKKEIERLRRQVLTLQAQIVELEQSIQAEDTSYGGGRVVSVGYMRLQPRPFTAYLQIQGSVENRRAVTLTARIPAIVSRIYVQEGQQVAAGQILLEQEAEVLRKNLSELRTRLELARTLYEKQKKLYEEGIGTEVQYLTAKNNKESLEAAMAALEEQIRNAQLRAPFAGKVDLVQAKVGEMLSPGMPAIRLVSAGQWEVRAEVPESFLPLAQPGLPADIWIPDLNLRFTAPIASSTEGINSLSRTFSVVVRDIPPAYQNQLRPNMVAYLQLPRTQLKQALVVPVEAVQFQDTGAFVFQVRGNRATRVPVSILATQKGEVAISGGVRLGDTIITTGISFLSDGQRVRLTEWKLP